MKSILLALLLLLGLHQMLGQCLEHGLLQSLFDMSLKVQKTKLSSLGFKLDSENPDWGVEWHHPKEDTWINIRRGENLEVTRVQYRLKGKEACYYNTLDAMGDLGFSWQKEAFDEYGTQYTFYKSSDAGIILSTWLAPEGYTGNFYTIELHSLASYQSEFVRR